MQPSRFITFSASRLARRLLGSGMLWFVFFFMAWPAVAQTVVADKSHSLAASADVKLIELAVLKNVNPEHGLADVLAGKSGVFVPQNHFRISTLEWNFTDLWLRLTLKAMPTEAGKMASSQYVLEFPKPYVNEIRLYAPPAAGSSAWHMQIAGDVLPPEQWALRGLYPRFLLPDAQQILQTSGQQVVYVQIKPYFPIQMDMQILPAMESDQAMQATYMALALTFGAMLLTAFFAVCMTVLYRDSIFFWFSAYVMAVVLSACSHSGLAHLMLWPVGGDWPGTATLFWLLWAMACQLQFCRLLFEPHGQATWLAKAAIGLGLLCALTAVWYIALPAYWTYWYFLTIGLLVCTALVASSLVFLAWYEGNALAMVWTLAFVPLFVTLVAGLLEGIGWTVVAWAYNMPIYAVAVEVIVMGGALLWFSRERHNQIVREYVLAATDPLTEVATIKAAETRLVSDWNSAATRTQNLAIAYVQVNSAILGFKPSAAMLRRAVGMLRSVVSSKDTIARMDDYIFAIYMPKMSMGEELSQRLSRLVELGLVPQEGGDLSSVIRFRIVATTRWDFSKPLTHLDDDLRDTLAREKAWGTEAIRYIDGKAPSSH
jgi:GGDEF domain-containing protein